MQSKHSAVLAGELILLGIVCLLTAFIFILLAGGQCSYRCGGWVRAWINQNRMIAHQAQTIVSENPNLIISEPGIDPESVPNLWELPLEPLPAPKQLLLKAPTKTVLYLLPPASESQPDYAAMTIRKLKRIARDRQIPNYGRMTKAQLLKTLIAT
jgi:Rho termination factor, N-terminal domain